MDYETYEKVMNEFIDLYRNRAKDRLKDKTFTVDDGLNLEIGVKLSGIFLNSKSNLKK